MRVLYITTAFARHERDHITPWLTETIKVLRKKGVEVEVFTSSYKGLGNQTVCGIPVYRFRYFLKNLETLTHEEAVPERIRRKKIFLFLLPFYLGSGIIHAFLHSRRKKYDIIHVHWPFPHILFALPWKLKKVPVISTFHGVEIMWIKKKMPYLLPFIKFSIRISHAVTCNSSYTRSLLLGVEKSKEVKIIPFGSGIEVKEKKKIKRKIPSVLFVGRLVERKGVTYLLKAWRKVRERKHAHLFIVGDGPLRKELEREAEELGIDDSVTFTGYITNEELDRMYRSSDLFVLPACVDSKGDTEGLGVVLIEALSREIPVVACAVGGIVDIVKHMRTGILVPEKNPDALADAILTLLENKKLASRLAREGKRWVEENFSWEAVAKKLISLYHSISG